MKYGPLILEINSPYNQIKTLLIFLKIKIISSKPLILKIDNSDGQAGC